jgi:hypothetical protein
MHWGGIRTGFWLWLNIRVVCKVEYKVEWFKCSKRFMQGRLLGGGRIWARPMGTGCVLTLGGEAEKSMGQQRGEKGKGRLGWQYLTSLLKNLMERLNGKGHISSSTHPTKHFLATIIWSTENMNLSLKMWFLFPFQEDSTEGINVSKLKSHKMLHEEYVT